MRREDLGCPGIVVMIDIQFASRHPRTHRAAVRKTIVVVICQVNTIVAWIIRFSVAVQVYPRPAQIRPTVTIPVHLVGRFIKSIPATVGINIQKTLSRHPDGPWNAIATDYGIAAARLAVLGERSVLNPIRVSIFVDIVHRLEDVKTFRRTVTK
jgi:hypothetical protein